MILANIDTAIINHIRENLEQEDYKLENSSGQRVQVKLFEGYMPIKSTNVRRDKEKLDNDFMARREQHKEKLDNEKLETKESDIDPEDIPCIIVRPISGIENVEEAVGKAKLIFITYSEDINGYKNCLNLMESVRRTLTTNIIIDGQYSYKRVMNWRLFEEQPYPYWYGEMNIEFDYGYYEDNIHF